MKRRDVIRGLLLFGLVAVLTGCIPVTEPLTDVSQAEPDRRLVGAWVRDRPGGLDRIVIDTPAVEGNPRGLMRVRSTDGRSTGPDWMFPTAIGKETYLNVLLGPCVGGRPADFARPGEFARWPGRKGSAAYLIGHYRVEGDTLVINSGDRQAFRRLMTKDGYDRPGPGVKLPEGYSPAGDPFYYPPPAWLTAHLAKAGPADLFPKAGDRVYTWQKQ